MRKNWQTTSIVVSAVLSLGLIGCGEKKEEDTSEETGSTTGGVGGGGTATDSTITMTGTLALDGTALIQDALADLILYCVTFETTPAASTSLFDDTGGFSVTVKANTPFGCFVNETATNKTRATFVLETGITGGLGGGSSNSMALSADVDLGALVIGASGDVKISADKVAGKKATTTNAIDLDLVHNSTYQMECVDNGNAESLASCIKMLVNGDDPMTVFFRLLKGKKGEEDIFGLGVWQDQASFDNCGSFDVSTEDLAGITEEGYVLSQVASGTFVGANCVKRDPGQGLTEDNLQNYYAFSRLIPTESGYSFADDEENDYNQGQCHEYHSTSIEFAGTSAEMIGAFKTKDIRSGDCGTDGEKEEIGFFNVKFVKQ